MDAFSTRLASKFAKLDGTNADQGAQLLTNILNVKSSTDPNTTILAERLAKVDASAFDVGQFVRLDGTNATNAGVTTMLNKLTDKVVTTKELTAETATLAKLDGKNINVDDFANKLSDKLAIRDGSNITDGFSDALKSKFVLVDGSNIEKSGLENQLADKFAAISSTSEGRTAAEVDPADTLPDA